MSCPDYRVVAIRVFAAVFLFLVFGGSAAQAQTDTTPGALRTYSTIYSIGAEWDIAGDTDHDAVVTVDYRIQGFSRWASGLPLVRIDYNGANMLAGSLLYLNPGTSYELMLSLSDPDGGAETRVVSVTTRELPVMPSTGRTFHVIPGSGGGDGSAGNPFRGVAAAQAVALPGDILLLHAGSYGGRIRFERPGAAGNYLVWKGAGDGEVLMNGIDIAASHIWLEGITVRNMAYATFSIAAPEDVVIRRCSFFNNHYSIYLQQGGRDWYIADNIIIGDTPYATESFDGEGIELNTSAGHTIAHNSITNTADGISYPLRNVDMFGNDIFDTSDDGIEGDYGYSNVRIWGNRIHNAVHNGISFQPQYGGPWYIIRNQIAGNEEAAFKFRTTDRFVLLHNTIVNWTNMLCCNDNHLFGAIARNNLWISAQGGQIWWFGAYTRDWRTDLDYDGFDWGAATNPFTYGSVNYPDVQSFAWRSGLETRGLRVDKNTCFESFDVPGPSPMPIPAQTFTLRPGCAAVDAGASLPNISDMFTGAAPDMGAYEYGRPAPSFGPRVGPTARLSASPATIAAGESTTLLWTTTDAVTVTIDPVIDATSLTGAREIAPEATTTYTLTATGTDSIVSETVTVTVNGELMPPTAPADLFAQALSNTAILVTWTNTANNETGLRIERSPDALTFTEIAAVGAGVMSYTDESLTPGSTYYYRVLAYNGAGPSSYSEVASATTPMPPTIPNAPLNLSASAVSSSRIGLAWEDASSEEQGFEIEQSTDGVSFIRIAATAANATTFSVTGLTPSTTYQYRVRARNAAGASPYSNTASATTLQAPLAAPTALMAAAVSRHQINLAWSDNSIAETGFQIERSHDGIAFSQIASVGANVQTYSDTTVRQNKRYYYRVRAYDLTTSSAYSNTATATTPRK